MGTRTRNFANNVASTGRPINIDVTEFDDDKIVNDISTLGLRVHTQENLAASNTNSQYVDVFQDATGYTNGADTARNIGEFVSSVSSTTTTADAGGTEIALGDGNTRWSSTGSTTDKYSPGLGIGTSYNYTFLSSSDGQDASHTPDNADKIHTGNTKIYFAGVDHNTGGTGNGTDTDYYMFGFLTEGSGVENTSILDHSGGANVSGIICALGGQQQDIRVVKLTNPSSKTLLGTISSSEISSASSVITMARMSGRIYILVDDVVKFTVPQSDFDSTADLFSAWSFGRGVQDRSFNAPKYKSGMTAIKGLTTTTANATGNFTCPAITAGSATTKMGAVITYQDNAGTNALNTDIVMQLSADNGSNFSTATLTALPDFSSGIKMAKVNDLAVTSGTQLKYKISFANQALGSKEARIRGVSLNY